MQLFSPGFSQAVTRLLTETGVAVLGTIPIEAIPFVEKIRNGPHTQIFEVLSKLFMSFHVDWTLEVLRMTVGFPSSTYPPS